MASATSIPNLGKLELSWVNTPFQPPIPSAPGAAGSLAALPAATEPANGETGKEKDHDMQDLDSGAVAAEAAMGRSEEYDPDVADDADRWGA